MFHKIPEKIEQRKRQLVSGTYCQVLFCRLVPPVHLRATRLGWQCSLYIMCPGCPMFAGRLVVTERKLTGDACTGLNRAPCSVVPRTAPYLEPFPLFLRRIKRTKNSKLLFSKLHSENQVSGRLPLSASYLVVCVLVYAKCR